MYISESYLDFVIKKIEELKNTQIDNINKAAEIIAKSCIDGGRLYVFGSGHSHIVAEEIYARAGGLALVKAMLEPELMLHEMPNKSTYLERLTGYSAGILKLYKVDCKDTVMVISNSGRNAVPIEMAIGAKKIRCKVIVITSMRHSSVVNSRHSSGLRLFEIGDVVIDNCAEFGDASFKINGLDTPIGPISTISGTTIAQTLISTAVDIMIKNGFKPPIFKSSNVDGADKYNNDLFDKFYSSIK